MCFSCRKLFKTMHAPYGVVGDRSVAIICKRFVEYQFPSLIWLKHAVAALFHAPTLCFERDYDAICLRLASVTAVIRQSILRTE